MPDPAHIVEEEQIQILVSENPLPESLHAKYEYIGELGSGGMATVFKARNRLSLEVVAIKILHDNSEKAQLRFRQEAVTVAKLQHPQIVGQRDFGIVDGVAYLVMEYVEGPTLDSAIKADGRIQLDRFKTIMSDICDALQYAHAEGVVHRDIKPSNIILTQRNGLEVAKLADFGIAKALHADFQQSLTQTGEVLGTPLYMSPEQCAGQQATTASDIYSLGCVMYECLSGAPPLVGQSFLETIHKRANETAPSLKTQIESIPLAISDAVDACLRTDPSQRCNTPAMLKQLLHCNSKVAAKPNGSRRVLITAMITALLAFIIVGFTLTAGNRQSDTYARNFDAGVSYAKHGKMDKARFAFNKALLQAEAAHDYAWIGEINLRLALIRLNLEPQNLAAPDAHFRRCVESYSRAYSPNDPHVLQSYRSYADALIGKEQYDQAESVLLEGIPVYQNGPGTQDGQKQRQNFLTAIDNLRRHQSLPKPLAELVSPNQPKP